METQAFRQSSDHSILIIQVFGISIYFSVNLIFFISFQFCFVFVFVRLRVFVFLCCVFVFLCFSFFFLAFWLFPLFYVVLFMINE